jgi:hypothetical protein
MLADLHVHTTASDGALPPAELVERAAEHGIEMLSITDHDTLGAYPDLQVPAGIELVPGVEFSARWGKTSVHIVGLDVAIGSDAMAEGQAVLHDAREKRARRIAERLRPLGLEDPLAAARVHADGAPVGRPHFAAALIEAGIVATFSEAFRRYLGNGKRGDIGQLWPDSETVIEWIRGAGGVAVLAHPLHYGMTRARLRRLVSAFVDAGGQGIEVLSGRQRPDATRTTTALAESFDLLASCGSDFHRPERYGPELGCTGALPDHLTPVWEAFR